MPPAEALEEAEKLSRDISQTCSKVQAEEVLQAYRGRIGDEGLRDIALTALQLIAERQLWPVDLITRAGRSEFGHLPGPFD
jgi:hypothetical protein